MATTTPYDLLRAELQRDSARPLVTFYDDATGERVELSVATFDNWVAKTAGLLRDDLATDSGARIAVLLPPHWQALVWAAACWALGACVVDSADGADVLVVGPDTLDQAATTEAEEVVALSLRPLGGRFADPLPIGVLDYAVEVPGHPDRLAGYVPPAATEPALEHRGISHTLSGLVDQARERGDRLGADPGARLLVSTADLRTALLDALLVPMVVGGSAVLVRNEADGTRDSRIAAERVTVVAPAGAESEDAGAKSEDAGPD
ncbi:TIGR03089 family protein [Phytoactinopolyspora halotolerans]|uniref:TIGR03089 family protein n=1 Tax=Phytoactinopolyspora halotolerans TaxID=1981512 RepID=A0A6L9SIE6_9ACTN|nr:TIGR03089 family protein [Phytoactinopolyspora halotolerans]NEE04101.1 TIGR03089 family protein [Phytoactinopolyspora halotolerans]